MAEKQNNLDIKGQIKQAKDDATNSDIMDFLYMISENTLNDKVDKDVCQDGRRTRFRDQSGYVVYQHSAHQRTEELYHLRYQPPSMELWRYTA